jgi:hypothetical protein
MRALNVAIGVSPIFAVWIWMLATVDTTHRDWWAVFFLASKIASACFITGPVYREYLR